MNVKKHPSFSGLRNTTSPRFRQVEDQNPNTGGDVVIDLARIKLSDLWKKEDYLAIWLGILILLIGLVIFLPKPPADMNSIFEKSNAVMKAEESRAPFKTMAWHKAAMEKRKLRATSEKYAMALKDYLDTPYDWKNNPLGALYLSPSYQDFCLSIRVETSYSRHPPDTNRTNIGTEEIIVPGVFWRVWRGITKHGR